MGRYHELFPSILEKKSDELAAYQYVSASALPTVEAKADGLEALLNTYQVDFPFFIKVDAWKAYVQEDNYDLWILERMGWGRWQKKNQLLYVVEGVPIPKLDDAEVVSVNSSTAPFLTAAKRLAWDEEIMAEEVQASALRDAPNVIKEKAYPYLSEFCFLLGDTLSQMKEYSSEFDSFIDTKINEYLTRLGEMKPQTRSPSLLKYFHNERRVELFQEFMEQKYPEKA